MEPVANNVVIMKNESFISQDEVYLILRSFFCENQNVSIHCFNDLCQRTAIRNVRKGELILSEGQLCDYLFFIARGFCFTYYVWEGKEHVLDFFKEGTFAFVFHSFFKRQSSCFNVRVSENSTLVGLKYSDFMDLSKNYGEFRDMMCRLYIEYWIKREVYQHVFRCYTAEERIFFFLKSHEIQDLMRHVPQYRIASWLNMAPETFAKLCGSINFP